MVSFILPGNSASTGYDVDNSIRFDEASTTFLSKASFGSPTSTKKSTVSFWCKRSLVEEGIIFMNDSNTFPIAKIYFDSSHRFSYIEFDPSVYLARTTNAVFRDLSAWSHFVVSVDMTESSADDRVKVYHNGTQITSFSTSTTPAQNSDVIINDNLRTGIGGTGSSGGDGFEGYVAELVRIDGQALDPTSFGEFDEDSNIWKPINVSGLTFGNNGFYLDFENSAELGTDVSGNSNTFTENNLTAEHQSTDTCTNNFATFNPLIPNSNITYSEGNLDILRDSGGDNRIALSTIAVSSGKWYVEMKCVQNQDHTHYGIVAADSAYSTSNSLAQMVNAFAYKMDGTVQEYNQSNIDTGEATFTTGDIIGIALDMDNNKIYFHKNGTYINSGDPAGNSNGYSITADKEYYFASAQNYATGKTSANFGSPSFSISSGNSDANGYGNFEYSVPSGYYSLCTKNLADYG